MLKKYFILITLFYLSFSVLATQLNYKPLKESDPPKLFFSSDGINFRRLFKQAMKRAEKTIDLSLYRLSDPTLMTLIQDQSSTSSTLTLRHDEGQKPLLSQSIDCQPLKTSGIMHQKILLIDQKEVWLGSANWTKESIGVHENMVASLYSPPLARALQNDFPHATSWIEGQKVELWQQPNLASLEYLIELIESASDHLLIAMYAFSHPRLAEALIHAKERGVKVGVVLDSVMCASVNRKVLQMLRERDVDVKIYKGMGLMHHKLAWIDQCLIFGSTNWTRAAFSKNKDCFLVLHALSPLQERQVRRFWRVLQASSIE